MYVDLEERRYLSGKTYGEEERLDLYVKGCCVLDKSLKINSFFAGVNIVTNNKILIINSLQRIGYTDINVVEIPFSLNVPKGIPFYSAHFKIDVFKYFASRPSDEYSILLDSDVICLHDFNGEFYSIIDNHVPMVYYLNTYGGEKKLKDVCKIDTDIKWMPWVGGEFIGGDAIFFSSLYREIMLFKEEYWNVVSNGLFHVGDEMLTSIAIARLRKKNICPVDAKWFGVIHRYWSEIETKRLFDYDCPLMHIPGDKIFEHKINLNVISIEDLLKGYKLYCIMKRTKGVFKNIVGCLNHCK